MIAAKLISIKEATDQRHKFVASVMIKGKLRTIPFGAHGMMDYTLYHAKYGSDTAEMRRHLYIVRHRAREDWNDPLTPGFYSRWILWEKSTIKEALSALKIRFPGLF